MMEMRTMRGVRWELRTHSAGQRTLGSVRVGRVSKFGVRCRATSNKQEGSSGGIMSAKLQALAAGALPLLTALPAGAHELPYYLQLASPGLAVVLGSLAFAAASPNGLRGAFAKQEEPAVALEAGPTEVLSLDQIKAFQAGEKEGPAGILSVDQIKAFQSAEEDVLSPSTKPVQKSEPTLTPAVAAISTTIPSEIPATRETDAMPHNAEKESEISFLTAEMEKAQGRGRMLLLAFAGQLGRGGSLSHEALAGALQPNPLKKEKGTLQLKEATSQLTPVKKAKKAINHVMEWSGLDARETKKNTVAETSVKSNVVPLLKTSDQRELVTAGPGGKEKSMNANENEKAKPAAVAQMPSILKPVEQESAAKLQEEHKQRIAGLKSQMSTLKAETPSTEPQPTSVPRPVKQQEEYNQKVTALKLSAAQKQRQEEERWQKRSDAIDSLNKKTQERAVAPGVTPYRALATTKKAEGLSKLLPKAFFGSIVEKMIAMWNVVINTAKRLFGQKPGNNREVAA